MVSKERIKFNGIKGHLGIVPLNDTLNVPVTHFTRGERTLY